MMYSALAPYYDSLMSHVDYNDWLLLIQSVIRTYSTSSPVSIFEIGSGTGTLGKLLSDSGYAIQTSDLNYEMAKIANKKIGSVFCADARNIPLKIKYDLVLFLYDGINYLTTLNDYAAVFKSVASILNTNGLFLFDITTETNSDRYFQDYSNYEEYGKVSLYRHSYYLQKKHEQHNDFTIFTPLKESGNVYLRNSENHIQYLFKPVQIKKVIPTNLFKCIGIWDGYSQHTFHRYSERIHFLLKRT